MKHHPDVRFCMRCDKLKENCESLPFESMPKFGSYAGVAILVKCTEFVKREKVCLTRN